MRSNPPKIALPKTPAVAMPNRLPRYAGTWPLLLVAALLTAANVHAGDSDLVDIKDTVKRSYKVRPGGTLELDIDQGRVEVLPGSAREVLIEVERKVTTDSRARAERIFERHELEIEERDGGVYVGSRFDREDTFWNRIRSSDRLTVRVRARIPEDYDIEFRTGAGNVELGSFSGDVSGVTGAGNIEIGAVSGSVEVVSGSGNIDIESAGEEVEVYAGAGNVVIRSTQGEATVKAGAGNIEVYITDQPDGASHLRTGAGNVMVYVAGGVGVDVDAECAVGSASTDYPLKVEGKWTRKSFAGSINGGGPNLRLYAAVGNVALRKQ